MTLSERLLNSVNLKPPQIEVKGSNIWKEKDMSKIEDLKTIEKTFDWTFSTPYKGTISSLSSVYDEINTRDVPFLKSLKDLSRSIFSISL